MSGPFARSWRGENNPTPGRLAHLKAEIAASDRTLPLRKFNYRNEDLKHELAERSSLEDWLDALSVIRSTVGSGPSVAWLGQRDALLKRVLR